MFEARTNYLGYIDACITQILAVSFVEFGRSFNKFQYTCLTYYSY